MIIEVEKIIKIIVKIVIIIDNKGGISNSDIAITIAMIMLQDWQSFTHTRTLNFR